MSKKDEALKMAIEAFVRWEDTYKADCTEVINACKEALEQPAQEPVAWMLEWRDGEFDYWHKHVDEDKLALEMWFDAIRLTDTEYKIYPLYTHPHQWQGLTDDDMSIIFDKFDWKEIEIAGEHLDLFKFSHTIEQALRIKNDH